MSSLRATIAAQLKVELNDPTITADAGGIPRSLVDRIVIQPGEKRKEIGRSNNDALSNPRAHIMSEGAEGLRAERAFAHSL